MTNNLTCVLVDDENKAIELLKDSLEMLFPNLIVKDTFGTWSDALHALRTTTYDLVFLDISMPGKTGFDLLHLLPELEGEVIFVTAHSDRALNAFEFLPSGYVLKPIDEVQLSNAVSKAMERAGNRQAAKAANINSYVTPKRIAVPNSKGTDFLTIEEIVSLESINGYTRVSTIDSDITSSYPLNRFKIILEKHAFFQVHRSFIVNLRHIKRYTNEGGIYMANGEEIPVSRNFRDELLVQFEKVSKTDM